MWSNTFFLDGIDAPFPREWDNHSFFEVKFEIGEAKVLVEDANNARE